MKTMTMPTWASLTNASIWASSGTDAGVIVAAAWTVLAVVFLAHDVRSKP